jgi:inositol-phosphate transport system substrate-binding protein
VDSAAPLAPEVELALVRRHVGLAQQDGASSAPLKEAAELRQVLETPENVNSGEMTIWDFGELVKEVVDGGAAEMGMLHRPNAGPDYLMTFATFGVKFQDPDSGKLLLPRAEMQKALEWYDWMARNGATPENNTAMSWDDIQNAFKQERAFAYHHGVWTMDWQLGEAMGGTWPNDEQGYFNKIGWIPAPAAEQGGEPTNLSHPIVYVVNPQSEHAQLAAQVVAVASRPGGEGGRSHDERDEGPRVGA